MNEWWSGLQPREQWMVGSGVVIVPLLLIYLLLWEPMINESRKLEQQLGERQALQEWMVAAVAEVERRRARGGPVVSSDGRSLLTRIDQGIKQAGLAATLKRVKPEGDNRVSLTFEGVGFDSLLGWLAELTGSRSTVTTESLVVTRSGDSGRVDARLVVEQGG